MDPTLRGITAKSNVTTPIMRGDAVIGAIGMGSRTFGGFSDSQVELLKTFAEQAAIAITSAETYRVLNDRTAALTARDAENTRLITEQKEALEQQTATAEVLQVINASPGELTSVFNAMLEKAMRLCRAAFGLLSTWDGEKTHRVASRGLPSAYAARRTENEAAIDPQSALGQALDTRRPAQTLDLTALDSYRNGHPGIRAIADVAGARTILQVPLVQDQVVTGFFTFYRTEVRAFSDKHIALLENFAAQAVIAMDSARLLGELRERTAELAERNTAFAERIDHQAATIDVLKAMAASPGDPQPVFDLIVRQAREQCNSEIASLFECDGTMIYCRALISETWSREEVEGYARQFPTPLAGGSLAPSSAIGTAIREQRIVHIRDAHAADERISEGARRLGLQSGVMVPLIRGGRAAGAIVLSSKDAGGCSDTQVELLKTFAEQAVIAIASAETYRALQTRTADLQESLEYQTATSDVLKVISRATFDLQPVLEAVAETAARLSSADIGVVARVTGDTLQVMASVGDSPEYVAHVRARGAYPFDRKGPAVTARAVVEGRVVHVHDTAAVPGYPEASTRLGNQRTALGVPLMRDGEPIGVILLARHRVEPFADQQIALVRTFADQAVIAIENTRLVTEQREALEQQTATAEVLQVINASPGDLAPVFQAMLDRAVRLCGADFGEAGTIDNGVWTTRAITNMPPEFSRIRKNIQQEPGPGTSTWHLIRGDNVFHVADLVDTDAYRDGLPSRREMVDVGGARALLSVALRKDAVLLGSIGIMRREPGPFSERQITLLENFAAQAVIAIENARLLTETREALEQQTATAEVLGVINASPGDLTPVFEAILEKAHRICRFDHGALALFDGTHFRSVATRGYGETGDAFSRVPYRPSGAQRLVLRGARYGHIPDISAFTADPDDTVFTEFVALTGFRTTLLVPLRKDGVVIGHISGWRLEAGPFSDKEIALLENFAAQAVIAMENARLLTEQREALERQTATAEVLQIINESPGNLGPVFETILEKAHAVCGVSIGSLFTWDGELMHAVATHGQPEHYAAQLAHGFRPTPGLSGRLVDGERFVHLPDIGTLTPELREFGRQRHRSNRDAHPAADPAPQGGGPAWFYQCGADGSSSLRGERDRSAGKLRGPGGDRDGERAAADGNARSAGTADRDGRGVAGDQRLAGRSGAGVPNDARSRFAPLWCGVWRTRQDRR